MKRIAISAAAVALCAAALQAATVRPEKSVVAKVNGKDITAGEVTTRLWWQNASNTLTELVDEQLLLAEADRLKIKADPKEVSDRLAALKASATPAVFERNLKAVGWTEADLRNLLTKQITIRETVMAAKGITITEEGLRNFFEANKDKLAAPESVKLSQIFVRTQGEAESALEALQAGADFGKLSALKSADDNLKKSSGDLGFVSRGVLLPDLEKEIFSLPAKKPSPVMATGNGFSIFQVEERKASQPADFEKIKNDIRVNILNQALAQKLPELAGELRQKAKIEVVAP